MSLFWMESNHHSALLLTNPIIPLSKDTWNLHGIYNTWIARQQITLRIPEITICQSQKPDSNRQYQHYKYCVLPLNYSGRLGGSQFCFAELHPKEQIFVSQRFSHSRKFSCMDMRTFHVYNVLTTTLTPTVGFEPTDLSAHLLSKQLAYNHLHTLAYPLIKPLVQLIYHVGVALSFTSRNLPELPTTATHGLWSYLSGKVFLQGSSAGISCLAIWKSTGSRSRTHNRWI